MSRRRIHQVTTTTATVKVFWDTEAREYVARLYLDGRTALDGLDYFTTDRDDAIATAERMADGYAAKPTAPAPAADVEATRAKLLAEMRAALVEVEAAAADVAGYFLVGLKDTRLGTAHHFEDVRGVVRFLRFDKAQRYTRFDFANARRSDIARRHDLPAGYSVEVFKADEIAAHAVAELQSVIATIQSA